MVPAQVQTEMELALVQSELESAQMVPAQVQTELELEQVQTELELALVQ